ncbi:MAG: ABC transporter substrate-binding protein [Thermomicrobiales bacterium]|nr:ABC transporter substrate-binding protein [Thermomicrobiales bacterium]
MGNRLDASERDFDRRQLLKGGIALSAGGLIAAAAVQSDALAAPSSGRAAALGSLQDEEPQQGGELIIGYTGDDPDSLDPQISAWNGTSSLANNIFDSLILADAETNSYHPALAESWEINEDATQFTFQIRQGVTFSDGTPLNAEAVKFSFDRIADPATASKLAASLLGPYTGSEVLDEYTVQANFSEPNAALLDSLSRANLGIVSPSAVQEMGPDFERNPVGSGYFIFEEWVANQHIKLVRNPDYAWASSMFTHDGPAHLDGLLYQAVPDLTAALAALDQEEIHVLGVADYRQLKTLQESERYNILTYDYRGFPSSYLMNTEKAPTNDIAVRQAILHAINPDVVVQISFAGVPGAASAPLTSKSLGFDPGVAEMYPYDPDKARQILDDAGWLVGDGGVREKDGERLSVIFIGSAGWEPYAIPVQPLLSEVGIEMEIRILTSAARAAANIAGEHNLAGLGFSSSDPSVLTNLFHSKNIENGFAWSRFNDPTLDDLLVAAQGEPDIDARVELYRQIQTIIMENALCVPLVEGLSATVMQPNVQGVTLDTRGFPYFFDAWMKS